MQKYVAFLRGANVGGRIVKSKDLENCFRDNNFTDVKTFLQSGNIVFSSEIKPPSLKKIIEPILQKTFNFEIKIQVLSLDKLSKVVKNYPFVNTKENQHDYVIFIENGLETSLAREKYDLFPSESIEVGDGVVYWRVDKGLTLKSTFGKLLSKTKYKPFNTNRNLKTLIKIVAE